MSMLEYGDGMHIGQLLCEIIKSSAQAKPLLMHLESKKNQGSIVQALIRIQHTLQLPNQNVILGIALLRRLTSCQVRITQRLITKLMTVCLMLIEKLYSDDEYSIGDFSLVSGISVQQLASIESEVINLLDYNLVISERQYHDILSYLTHI